MTPAQLKVLLSSKSVEWGTPWYVFDFLQGRDPFVLDVCASEKNHKVSWFFDLEDDALTQRWIGKWWCNPPYGRWLKRFAQYGVQQVKENGSIGTYLVPARVDTKWFSILRRQAAVVLFIEGRIPFVQVDGALGNSAPFPCCAIEIVPNPPPRPLVDWIKIPKPKVLA